MKSRKKQLRYTSLLAVILSITGLAAAQTAEKKTLTLQGAERVIAAAKTEAKRLQAPGGVVAVVDDGGKALYLCAQTGLYRIRLKIPGIRP